VKRISKPGRRLYVSHREAHSVKGGGRARASSRTPSGVATDKEARKNRAGGENLFLKFGKSVHFGMVNVCKEANSSKGKATVSVAGDTLTVQRGEEHAHKARTPRCCIEWVRRAWQVSAQE